LSDLVRLGLARYFLEVQKGGNAGVSKDVMASSDTLDHKAKTPGQVEEVMKGYVLKGSGRDPR
jgi:hypothetical protein